VKRTTLAVIVALVLGYSSSIQAGIIISVAESGSDVVFGYSGDLDTAGLVPTFITNGLGFLSVEASQTALAFGVGPSMQGYTVPSLAAIGAPTTPTSLIFGDATGGGFAMFTSGTMALPFGYVSGTNIAGTLTLDSQSFASLGLIDGTYESLLPSGDFVRLTIATTQVPEPGTLSLLAAGLLTVGALRFRNARRLTSWLSCGRISFCGMMRPSSRPGAG
jgi:PEP-CTERM motif